MTFTNCVEHGGKIYWWNKEMERICEIEVKEVYAFDVPKEVIIDLRYLLHKEKEK